MKRRARTYDQSLVSLRCSAVGTSELVCWRRKTSLHLCAPNRAVLALACVCRHCGCASAAVSATVPWSASFGWSELSLKPEQHSARFCNSEGQPGKHSMCSTVSGDLLGGFRGGSRLLPSPLVGSSTVQQKWGDLCRASRLVPVLSHSKRNHLLCDVS